MVIVITGSGFNIDQMKPFLLGLLLSTREKLEPNPAGDQELTNVLSAAAQGTVQPTSVPMPDIAMEITNQTYTCRINQWRDQLAP
jgi:hypothetical protein